MPRGQRAHDGKWNFRIVRFRCPVCNRMDVIKQHSRIYNIGNYFTCMYRYAYKKDCKSEMELNEKEVHNCDRRPTTPYPLFRRRGKEVL